MRRSLKAAVALVGALLCGAGAARAQLPVIDTANLSQNLLTAARTLEEINNQLMQIQQLTQMLEYDARNITSLNFLGLGQLTGSLDQVNGLMSQARSLAYNVNSLQNQFATLFPTYGSGVTQAQLLGDAQTRWQASVSTFQHTMQVQSQIVSDIAGDEALLSTLVGQSQGATGALQAMQATNQLLALQSKQLAATQTLLSASGRAQGTESMRQVEEEEAGRAEWQRFWGNGVSYTPVPVQAFRGTSP
jgi:P-type conjugative transfer protein TrbJ